jgi:hypothetical protein
VCDFCRQCRPFPDDRSIQKDIRTVWPYFHSELDGRPQTIEVVMGNL